MNASNDESIAEERRLFYVALTRPRRRLNVYVPFRYYHHPQARDDGHGYGKASRFLTDDVKQLFTVVHTVASDPPAAGPDRPARRIEVSLDALFG
jgi:DNA helicase-2/ATP-dependent DNA helicase PcrA